MEASSIAMVGMSADILIFNAAGVRAELVDSPERAAQTIKMLAADGFKLIFVTCEIASAIPDVISSYKRNPFPIVVSLPDANGKNPYSIANMTENVEKAVGINLFEQ